MNAHEIADLILGGDIDADLELLASAISDRRHALRQRLISDQRKALKAGDAVKIVGNIRPKYIRGMPGVIESVGYDKAEVLFDYPVGRYGHNGPVGVPLNCLEKRS